MSVCFVWPKVRSYMAIMACFSSPALQRISATALTRHFLLVVPEILNFLRTKLQLRKKNRSPLFNATMQGSLFNSSYKACLDVK